MTTFGTFSKHKDRLCNFYLFLFLKDEQKTLYNNCPCPLNVLLNLLVLLLVSCMLNRYIGLLRVYRYMKINMYIY